MSDNTTEPSPYAIGADLKSECDGILALRARLKSAVEGDEMYQQLLSDTKKPLTNAVASVSFIGQVKAGKTSLVNALIGKPDFLPSDVNPWTAVVTKLFFGKPGGPNDGAKFSFFDDAQWDRFANRGGRLGELAKEIPESENKLDELRGEVEQMKARAKKQLGENYSALLGKTHRFDGVSTDILARYICAGDDPEALVTKNVHGRFADITREASVFFDMEKFAFPSVIVDTPGLNDPLMIREEITLQSLEHSHIFVLVLSAHQAFSSADLYLLRILNALRLDRLVVFVNRVDELTDPETDGPAIHKHITSFLKKESPGAEIPVIFGSAACASKALNNSDDVDLAQVKSVRAINKGVKQPKSSTQFTSPVRQSAWLASGMPLLESVLSDMMLEGPGKTWVNAVRIDLNNVANMIIAKTDATITELKKKLTASGQVISDPDFDIKQFETESERLLKNLNHVLDKKMNTAWGRIQTGLQEITEEFIREHDKEFALYLVRAKKSKAHVPWSCDTTPLRRNLKHYLNKEFPNIQSSVLRSIERGVEEISLSMADAGIPAAKGLQMNTAELASQTPTTTALSKTVAIDMESSWWKGWISKFKRNKAARTNIAKMIRSQFHPIQNELMEGMNFQLVTSTNNAMTSYRNMITNLTNLLAKSDVNAELTSVKDIEDKISILNQRTAVCKEISATLQKALAA